MLFASSFLVFVKRKILSLYLKDKRPLLLLHSNNGHKRMEALPSNSRFLHIQMSPPMSDSSLEIVTLDIQGSMEDSGFYVAKCPYCRTVWDGNAQHVCIYLYQNSQDEQEDEEEIILIDSQEEQEDRGDIILTKT